MVVFTLVVHFSLAQTKAINDTFGFVFVASITPQFAYSSQRRFQLQIRDTTEATWKRVQIELCQFTTLILWQNPFFGFEMFLGWGRIAHEMPQFMSPLAGAPSIRGTETVSTASPISVTGGWMSECTLSSTQLIESNFRVAACVMLPVSAPSFVQTASIFELNWIKLVW